MASNITDEQGEELEAVLGQTLGFVAQEGDEWYLVFLNGARLTLSASHAPYFKIGYKFQ